jgi:hypothetical protein
MSVAYYFDDRVARNSITFFALQSDEPVDISGYDRMLRQRSVGENRRFQGDGISYEVNSNLDTMTISIDDTQTGIKAVQVDIGGFATKLLHDFGDSGRGRGLRIPTDVMTIAAEQNGQKAKVFFRSLEVTPRREKASVSSFTVDIAYTVRK